MVSIFKQFRLSNEMIYCVTEENKKAVVRDLEILDSFGVLSGKTLDHIQLQGDTWKVPKKKFKSLHIEYNQYRETLRAPYGEKCFD